MTIQELMADIRSEQAVEADAQRKDAEAIFIASMRDYAAQYSWPIMLRYLWFASVETDDPVNAAENDIKQFAEIHGWPDTLVAIATAMRADETAKREAFERR